MGVLDQACAEPLDDELNSSKTNNSKEEDTWAEHHDAEGSEIEQHHYEASESGTYSEKGSEKGSDRGSDRNSDRGSDRDSDQESEVGRYDHRYDHEVGEAEHYSGEDSKAERYNDHGGDDGHISSEYLEPVSETVSFAKQAVQNAPTRTPLAAVLALPGSKSLTEEQASPILALRTDESDRLSAPRPKVISAAIKPELHSSITISDDQSESIKVLERQFHALRDREEDLKGSSHFKFPNLHGKVVQQATLAGRWVSIRAQESAAGMNNPSVQTTLKDESLNTGQAQNLPQVKANNPKIVPDGLSHPWRDPLNNNNVAHLTFEELNTLIEQLQQRASALESGDTASQSVRTQCFYRILAENNSKNGKASKQLLGPFFDIPERIDGQGTSSVLRSRLPVENFDLFLEQNKNLSFIVYLTYEQNRPTHDIGTEPRERGDLPEKVNESIRPVSKALLSALETVLGSCEEYASILGLLRRQGELDAPYLFMYHLRSTLDEIAQKLQSVARQQLYFFRDHVQDIHGQSFADADAMISRGFVTPPFLEYLFKPGEVLVQRTGKQYRGWQSSSWPRKKLTERLSRSAVQRLKYKLPVSRRSGKVSSEDITHEILLVHHWSIDVWHWDFNVSFQRRTETLNFAITEEETDFRRERQAHEMGPSEAAMKTEVGHPDRIDIADLTVFPIRFAPHDVVERLRRRGRTFWDCRTRRMVSYQEKESTAAEGSAEERYVIDLHTYRSLHTRYDSKEPEDDLGPEAMAREEPPNDRFELLLPLKLKGYNLRQKKWLELEADRISDVKWNKEAFQQVVIDRKAKDLIRALVSNQLASEVSTDLISGKGNGLILLLHGGPGTGKTLTAESVAEIAEKPLYRVTCGDIGTRAEEVEKYLSSVFHLGKLWGCVVLLDEADVFLEQRSLEDLQRNALVSVFLRVLEYYEGILVLTSNRVGIFDEAFKSRIQLALHYPALGPYQRLRIWENFINRLGSFQDSNIDIDDICDHLDELKEEKMNGRQIRNAITTARQYAEWKKTTLTFEHLKDVIEVSGRFDKYLDKLNGGFTQDQLAEDEGIRLA